LAEEISKKEVKKPNPTSRLTLGHFQLGEFLLMVGFILFVAGILLSALGVVLGAPPFRSMSPDGKGFLLFSAGVGLICLLYARYVEPDRLSVRRIDLKSPKIKGEPIRLLHLSDVHVYRWSVVEEAVIARAKEFKPHAILLTGDYTSTDVVLADVQRFMREVAEIAPTYCSLGNAEYRKPPFEDLMVGDARWLLSEEEDLLVNDTMVFACIITQTLFQKWIRWGMTLCSAGTLMAGRCACRELEHSSRQAAAAGNTRAAFFVSVKKPPMSHKVWAANLMVFPVSAFSALPKRSISRYRLS
jgi:hypothetical protein